MQRQIGFSLLGPMWEMWQGLRQGRVVGEQQNITGVFFASHLRAGRSTPLEPRRPFQCFGNFFFAQAGEQLWPSLIKGGRFLFVSLPVAHPPTPCSLSHHPTTTPPPRRDPRLMCFSLPHNGLWNGEAARFVSAGSRSNANKSSLSRVGVVTEEKWEGLFAVCFLFKSRGHASLVGGAGGGTALF